MMKRVTWFVSGVVAGVAGAGYAKRKVKQTASQLAPTNIAKTAATKVRDRSHDVADAVREGREAMRAKEAELRSKLAGTPNGSDELDRNDMFSSDDEVLLDAVTVGAGQVIVVGEAGEQHSGPRRSSRPRRARREA